MSHLTSVSAEEVLSSVPSASPEPALGDVEAEPAGVVGRQRRQLLLQAETVLLVLAAGTLVRDVTHLPALDQVHRRVSGGDVTAAAGGGVQRDLM